MSKDQTLNGLPKGDSKVIVTNQQGIHEKLSEIVNKHLNNDFKKPYQSHTQQAFAEINTIVENFNGDIILDACCGVGQSTRILAEQNPHCLVIGVDKSANRLTRNVTGDWQGDNYYLIRADLNDFYRLVNAANWAVKKHYVLYPNPWPKSKHIQRRWHGSAVFPQMLQIGEQIILRSNWLLYLQEFQLAASIAGKTGEITKVVEGQQPLTPFEAKYQSSGQQCWQLQVKNTKN